MTWFCLFLAQHAETIGLLQTVLNGGVPLLLLIALCVVSWLYYKEKESKTKADTKYAEDTAKLRDDFTKKIEDLYKERLSSETENARMIVRATEALESVGNALTRTNETLDSLIEE